MSLKALLGYYNPSPGDSIGKRTRVYMRCNYRGNLSWSAHVYYAGRYLLCYVLGLFRKCGA